MRSIRIAASCLAIIVAAAARVHAQDPMTAARDLYAAAEYEDALELLDGLAVGAPTGLDRQAVDLYRTLCLLAVGRREEADKAIEAMIAHDPLYRPGDEVSPRMRSAFADARRRVLPGLVQQRYQQAKAAFDGKEFAAAADGFKRVVEALNDPDMSDAAARPPLADLRTLAGGFYDLSVKAIPPPPPPVEPPPPVDVAPRIYSIEDRQVVAPIVIQQQLPKFPGRVRTGGLTGVVEVVISEQGLVESVQTITSLGDAYDALLATAANSWQYYPARASGAPVKFRKRIQITVSSGPTP